MKDHEIFEIAERCTAGNCEGCPYTNEDCANILQYTLELAKRYKAELEQPVTVGAECATMPDYEAENRKLMERLCKLENELCNITIERDRAFADRNEMESELDSLRAVKATAEAFLGRKIEVK